MLCDFEMWQCGKWNKKLYTATVHNFDWISTIDFVSVFFFNVSFEILTWILMYDTSHGTSIAPNKTHTIAISYTLRNWKHFIFYLYLKCVFLFIQTSPLWNEANKTSRANSMQNIKREKKTFKFMCNVFARALTIFSYLCCCKLYTKNTQNRQITRCEEKQRGKNKSYIERPSHIQIK